MESPFTEKPETLLPSPRLVAPLIPFLLPSRTAGVGNAGLSRTQWARLNSKTESEDIKYKLGPNKSALSDKNLERERGGAMSISFPQISPTKPLPDFCETLSSIF